VLAAGSARDRLDGLVASADLGRRVTLSVSDALGSPVAIGVVRPEVCLPRRALTELAPAAQEAMLAHETAHHVRLDPLWLAGSRAIEVLFVLQPLNLLALRRLRHLAEVRCDAWAASRTGGGLVLAECLTQVAGWIVGERGSFAPAMAQRTSALGDRVRRLLGAVTPVEDERRPAVRRAAAAAAVLAVAVLAPRAGAEAPRPPASAPVVVETGPSLAADLALLDEEIAALEREASGLVELVRTRGLRGAPALLARRVLERIVTVRAQRERLRALTEGGSR
jgi:hypothetical protein